MRVIYVILMTVVISYSMQAQKAQQLFEHANELFEQGQCDSALYLFQKIYFKGKANRSLRFKAYYNSGIIYLQKKDTIKAKKGFANVLSTHFNEMDRRGTGSGLNAEPYALYKNNSCKILAEIAISEKDFEKALGYIWCAQQMFPYIHFCENANVNNQILLAEMYAKCYEGLGDTTKAIQYVIPEVLKKGPGENDSFIERGKRLVRATYSEQEIKNKIDSALKKITQSGIRTGYYTTLFGTMIHLEPIFYPYTDPVSQMNELDQIIYTILNSKFIKELLSGK